MDIHKWLSETSWGEPPELSPDPDVASELLVLKRNLKPRKHERYYQIPSDSSIVVAQPANQFDDDGARPCKLPREGHKRRRHARRPRPREHQQTEDDCTCSSASNRSATDRPAQKYRRRPRHKTRTDRYEPKHRAIKRAARPRKDHKKSPRKSRCNDDGARTAGLVQSFQLKNGPKTSRLTLQPDITSGLFRHGRASRQVSGRGRALPDLTFNEMKFLHQSHDHPDEAQAIASMARTQREYQHFKEKSAHFSPSHNGSAQRQHVSIGPDQPKDSHVHDLSALAREDERAEDVLVFSHLDSPKSDAGQNDAAGTTDGFSWSESEKRHLDKKASAPNSEQQILKEHMHHVEAYDVAHDKEPLSAARVSSCKRAITPLTGGRRPRTSGSYGVDVAQNRLQPAVESVQSTPLQTTSVSLPRHPAPSSLRDEAGPGSKTDVIPDPCAYRTPDKLDARPVGLISQAEMRQPAETGHVSSESLLLLRACNAIANVAQYDHAMLQAGGNHADPPRAVDPLPLQRSEHESRMMLPCPAVNSDFRAEQLHSTLDRSIPRLPVLEMPKSYAPSPALCTQICTSGLRLSQSPLLQYLRMLPDAGNVSPHAESALGARQRDIAFDDIVGDQTPYLGNMSVQSPLPLLRQPLPQSYPQDGVNNPALPTTFNALGNDAQSAYGIHLPSRHRRSAADAITARTVDDDNDEMSTRWRPYTLY